MEIVRLVTPTMQRQDVGTRDSKENSVPISLSMHVGRETGSRREKRALPDEFELARICRGAL